MRSRGGKDRFDISIILNLTFVSLTQSAVFHMESSHLKVILSTTGEDHGEDLTSLCPSIKESKLTRGTLQHDTNGAYLLVSTTWRCRERGREGSTHEEGAKEMEKRKVSEQRGMTRTSPVLWTLILAWPLLAALDFPRLLLSHPRILVPFARLPHFFYLLAMSDHIPNGQASVPCHGGKAKRAQAAQATCQSRSSTSRFHR